MGGVVAAFIEHFAPSRGGWWKRREDSRFDESLNLPKHGQMCNGLRSMTCVKTSLGGRFLAESITFNVHWFMTSSADLSRGLQREERKYAIKPR